MARVMVIDDDSALRRVLVKLLEEDGHEVVEESDGHSALRHFVGNPVDLVVSDVYMPAMDGIEFLKRVRETFPEAQIVMMSAGGALPADTVLEASTALGAQRVLSKPFSPEEFRDTVRSILGDVE